MTAWAPPSTSRNTHTDRSEYEKEFFQRERREKENRRRREVIEILGGTKPFEDFTFEKFRATEAPAAYRAALLFNPEKDNLFFYGINNTGKTHLATAIAHTYIDRGYDVRFFYVPNLIRDFRIRTGNADFAWEKKWMKKLIEAQVLGMDELGQGNVTDYVVDIICEILDGRIRAGRNGWIGTSNLPLRDNTFKYEDIYRKYGGKVYSRILRLCRADQLFLFPGKGSKS